MRSSGGRALLVTVVAILALTGVALASPEGAQCIFPPCCLCFMEPFEVPPVIVGESYFQVFSLTGDCLGPWTWHTAGQLPPGLSFSVTGHTLSGIPTTPGTYNFGVFAVRSGSNCTDIGRGYILIVTESSQVIEIAPTSGPASGGTAITVTGTGFSTGAVLTLGGATAADVVIVNGTEITASAPALTAGTLNDVSVTGTTPLPKGWLSDFLDVPQGNRYHPSVESIFRAGITAGCGGGDYCPGYDVTRAQAAVFILKGEHSGTYTPPACSGTIFTDEPCPGGPLVDWVNQLASEGITGGCGGGNYCPGAPVKRGQMAVFLLKGEHGGSYVPPACSFTSWLDVPCPGGPFVEWINQLGTEQISGVGCGGGNWCPYSQVLRGPMADFLVPTFKLQLHGP